MFADDGDLVQLTDQQEKLKQKLETILELKSCNMLSDKQIAEKLGEMYYIGIHSAYDYIGKAEKLFGYSQFLSKRYRMWGRINFLEEKAKKAWDYKDTQTAVECEKLLQKYYIEFPELNRNEKPHKLVFVYKGNKPLIDEEIKIEDAEYTIIKALQNGG
jgi:hypothetical protein